MEQYKRNPNITCIVCDKSIYRKPSQIKRNKGRVFCNLYCYGIHQRKEKPCVICGKMIMSKFNKKTCGKSCSNKHRDGIKYKIGRPNDKANSIRILKLKLIKEKSKKCERCSYSKYEILQIHHKDRNRKNNNIKNLEIICPNCHYEEHFLKKSWIRNEIEKKIKKDILG